MRQLYTWGGNDPLLEALLHQQVEFLVVGGMAVHFYDETRQPDDVDLMLRQTPRNAERVKAALFEAGLNPQFEVEEFMRPTRKQLSLKHLPPHNYYVDIVTPGPETSINDSEWSGSPNARLNAFQVRVASAGLVIELKRDSERQKDKDDVRRLSAFVS
jgi:hypothetical protein